MIDNDTRTKYQGYWNNIIDIISLVLILIIRITTFSNSSLSYLPLLFEFSHRFQNLNYTTMKLKS